MGNVWPEAKPELQQPLTQSDPFHNWPHPDHWHPKDIRLLRPETETQGHGSIRRWYTFDPPSLATHWLHHRDLWYIRSVWRLLRNHWLLCWEHTYRWPIPPDDTPKDWQWEEKCRATGMKTKDNMRIDKVARRKRYGHGKAERKDSITTPPEVLEHARTRRQDTGIGEQRLALTRCQ